MASTNCLVFYLCFHNTHSRTPFVHFCFVLLLLKFLSGISYLPQNELEGKHKNLYTCVMHSVCYSICALFFLARRRFSCRDSYIYEYKYTLLLIYGDRCVIRSQTQFFLFTLSHLLKLAR